MAAVRGTRSTSDIVAISQEVRSVSDKLFSVDGGFDQNNAPMVVLLNNIPDGKMMVQNYKYECFEEPFWSRRGTVTGLTAKNATSIVIAAPLGNEISEGTLLYVPASGERLLVNGSRTALLTWPVTRNAGAAIYGTDDTVTKTEGNGVAIADGSEIRLAGNAYGEGQTMPEAVSLLPESSYNYTQIFQRTTDITLRLRKMKLYAENDPLNVRTQKMMEQIKVDIQSMMLFGVRMSRTNSIGQLQTFSGGLFQHLGANGNLTADTKGIMTIRVLDAFMEKLFENYGSGRRYCFVGNQVASCLDRVMEGRVSIIDMKASDSYGVKMKQYETTKGTLRFVMDNKNFGGEMASTIMALDLDDGSMKYAYMDGCDILLCTGIQDSRNQQRIENGVFADVGLMKANYGLDHSMLSSTGEHRAKDGLLYTTASGGWTN